MEKMIWILGIIVTASIMSSPCYADQWAITYGGSGYNGAHSIQQTAGGGYVVAGRTDFFGAGDADFWVLKLSPKGAVEWQKTYGGSLFDKAWCIQQTAGGGYVVAGQTYSFGAGESDFWVLKLYPSGDVEWQNTYGGSYFDTARSIQQTVDGGYVVAGQTYSFGAGESDFWVLKLHPNGGVEWQKTYGGSSWDSAYTVRETSDEGYVVTGYTYSFGAGANDFWVLKLDSQGDVEWQKTYGGGSHDYAYTIEETSGGGYVLAGYTYSFGAGYTDFWVLKLDSYGTVEWQKTYGGSKDDAGHRSGRL